MQAACLVAKAPPTRSSPVRPRDKRRAARGDLPDRDAQGVRTVASYFVMVKEERARSASCSSPTAASCRPDPAQLADIAISTADRFRALTGAEPHVAMLSFSTKGSATHPHVDKVIEATARARALRPDLHIDGELQVDAALVPDVARIKAPARSWRARERAHLSDSTPRTSATSSCNGSAAGPRTGPSCPGSRSRERLSRGCSADDVVTFRCSRSPPWRVEGSRMNQGGAVRLSRIAREAKLSGRSPSTSSSTRRAPREGCHLARRRQPDFPSPPAALKGGIEAIESGRTRYTAVAGTPELRAMIARKLKEENGWR